jgi:hypothetical protein
MIIEIDPVPVDIPFVCVKTEPDYPESDCPEPDYLEPYDEIEIKEEELSDEDIVMCDLSPIPDVKEESPVIVDEIVSVKCEPLFLHPANERMQELERVGDNRQFFCYCGLTFTSKSEEFSHIRLNHNPKFKCNICGRISFNKVSNDKHIRHEHKQGFFTVNLLTKVSRYIFN